MCSSRFAAESAIAGCAFGAAPANAGYSLYAEFSHPVAPHFAFTPLDPRTVDSAAVTPIAWDGQRLATLTLTSGSSGLPKAAVHSLGAHRANADGVLALMNFTASDSWLLSLPLFHVSGQGLSGVG